MPWEDTRALCVRRLNPLQTLVQTRLDVIQFVSGQRDIPLVVLLSIQASHSIPDDIHQPSHLICYSIFLGLRLQNIVRGHQCLV